MLHTYLDSAGIFRVKFFIERFCAIINMVSKPAFITSNQTLFFYLDVEDSDKVDL